MPGNDQIKLDFMMKKMIGICGWSRDITIKISSQDLWLLIKIQCCERFIGMVGSVQSQGCNLKSIHALMRAQG